MKYSFYLTFFLICSHIYAIGQGSISGKVVDLKTAQPVAGVLVKVQPLGITFLTDSLGFFSTGAIPTGKYHLKYYKYRYENLVQLNIEVSSGEHRELIVEMIEDDSEFDKIFSIGTVDITANQNIINDQLATTFEINSGDIEHLQASGLGDVLELVPGTLNRVKMGLNSKVTATIRNNLQSNNLQYLESFGTQIMVDDVVLSNNGMMSSRGVGSSPYLNPGEGIDLRSISADHVQSVEVVQGVPSVKYGDFAEGVIKVNTKSQTQKAKLKFKYSIDTKDLSLNQGLRFKDYLFYYAANYAYSERDIRKKGDEYSRFSLSLKCAKSFFNQRLKLNYEVWGTRSIDEEKPTDFQQKSHSNRGYKMIQSLKLDYFFNTQSSVNFKSFLSITKNHYKASQLVDAQPTSYIGKMQEKGKIYHSGFHGIYQYTTQFYGVSNQFLTGVDFSYETNQGEGLILDEEKNFYGQYSLKRSYSYDWFPGIHQGSFFFEDQIEGKLWKEFAIRLGFRCDLFDLESVSQKARLGSFFSPRVNLIYHLFSNFRIRSGYGKSAKLPSFQHIYSAPDYYTLADTITTEVLNYIVDQSNSALHGYTVEKFEVGFDYSLKKRFALRINFYQSHSNNSPAVRTYPLDYHDHPNSEFKQTYSLYENIGVIHKEGIEFQLKSHNFQGLIFSLSGNYLVTKNYRNVPIYQTKLNTELNEPLWHEDTRYHKKTLVVSYYAHYTSPQLGAWLTLTFQHFLFDQSKLVDSYPDSGDEWKGMWYEYPDYWMVNFSMTKSLVKSFSFSLYIRNLLYEEARYYHQYDDVFRTRFTGTTHFGFELNGYLEDLWQ